MKAISLWQPWASFVIWGAKRYETRSWRPSSLQLCRGDLLAIHAAARQPSLDDWTEVEFDDVLEMVLEHGARGLTYLPRGCVLGVCRYLGVVSTTRVHLPGEEHLPITDVEARLGDWTSGRWAWELEVVEMYAMPIPCRGRQKLWEWDGGMSQGGQVATEQLMLGMM